MTLLKLFQEPAKVNILPSLSDLQVFLWSFDLVPECFHRAVMLTQQATSRYFTSIALFWQTTEISVVNDWEQQHEDCPWCTPRAWKILWLRESLLFSRLATALGILDDSIKDTFGSEQLPWDQCSDNTKAFICCRFGGLWWKQVAGTLGG